MAGINFLHNGDAVDHTPGSAVTAGDIVHMGTLAGIAKLDIASGELGALHTKGVFDFPKDGGGAVTFAVGDPMFWDVADGYATDDADSGTNKAIGVCVKAAVATDAFVEIKLNA